MAERWPSTRWLAATALTLSGCITTGTIAPSALVQAAGAKTPPVSVVTNAGVRKFDGTARLRLRILPAAPGEPSALLPGDALVLDLPLSELRAAGPHALLLPPYASTADRIPLERLAPAEFTYMPEGELIGLTTLSVIGGLLVVIVGAGLLVLSQVHPTVRAG